MVAVEGTESALNAGWQEEGKVPSLQVIERSREARIALSSMHPLVTLRSSPPTPLSLSLSRCLVCSLGATRGARCLSGCLRYLTAKRQRERERDDL